MWRILNAENQVLKYIQIFAAGKNQADLRNLAFAKTQADLRNPCAYKKSGGFTESLRLQKIRRIYRILASTENQAGDRILAGVEIPAPGKKPAELEKHAALLLFRLGGISSC
jgi:hypothetical protein